MITADSFAEEESHEGNTRHRETDGRLSLQAEATTPPSRERGDQLGRSLASCLNHPKWIAS